MLSIFLWFVALSDLSKSPLLHILHLVFPLEPKRVGEGGSREKDLYILINEHLMRQCTTIAIG